MEKGEQNMVAFNDVFKSILLSRSNLNSFLISYALTTLTIIFVLGLSVYFVHKKICGSGMYSVAFDVSLPNMPTTKALFVMAFISNIILFSVSYIRPARASDMASNKNNAGNYAGQYR